MPPPVWTYNGEVDRSKLTRQLRERVDRAPQESLIEVILEIQTPDPAADGSRSERMAAHRLHFDKTVEPVEQHIRRVGGEILEHAWLSQTVRARVPARHLDEVAAPECVASIDTPGALSRE